jgi:SPP1 gp7 family putative phage head morphogenesis protein
MAWTEWWGIPKQAILDAIEKRRGFKDQFWKTMRDADEQKARELLDRQYDIGQAVSLKRNLDEKYQDMVPLRSEIKSYKGKPLPKDVRTSNLKAAKATKTKPVTYKDLGEQWQSAGKDLLVKVDNKYEYTLPDGTVKKAISRQTLIRKLEELKDPSSKKAIKELKDQIAIEEAAKSPDQKNYENFQIINWTDYMELKQWLKDGANGKFEGEGGRTVTLKQLVDAAEYAKTLNYKRPKYLVRAVETDDKGNVPEDYLTMPLSSWGQEEGYSEGWASYVYKIDTKDTDNWLPIGNTIKRKGQDALETDEWLSLDAFINDPDRIKDIKPLDDAPKLKAMSAADKKAYNALAGKIKKLEPEKKPEEKAEPIPEPGKKKIKLYRTLSASTPEQLKAMQDEVFEGKLGKKEAKNGIFGEGLYFYVGEDGEKLANSRVDTEAWNQAIKDFKAAHADDPTAWLKFAQTKDKSGKTKMRPRNLIKKDPEFAPFYQEWLKNSQVITVDVDEDQINGYGDDKRSDKALKIKKLPLADKAAAVEKLGVYDDSKLGEFFIEGKEHQVLIRASKVKEFAATLTDKSDKSVEISPKDKKLIKAYIDWAKSTKSLQSELKETQANLKKHAAKKPNKKPDETGGNSEQYWKDRALQQKASTLRTGNGFNKAARNDLKGAAKEIEKATADFYERYAKTEDPELSLTDVKKQLRGSDKKNWLHTLDEWQELSKQAAEGDEEAEKAVQQEYLTSRVSRLKALEAQMKVIMSKYADNAADGLGKTLKETYKDTYYRTTYNIQGQKHEYAANFAKIDEDTLNAAITEDWHGSNFSKKVWDNYTDQLPTMLRESITRGVALGYGPDMLTKQIRTQFNNFNQYNVQRLVNTELGHVVETATMNAYTENNINEYEYMATLEAHTCEQCGDLDGQVFKTQDAQEGLNYPVMHPFCRCTTAPYVDWDWGEDDPGIWMRDPETGKGEIVESMTYNEWKKKFVDDRKDDAPEAKETAEEKSKKTNADVEKAAKDDAPYRSIKKQWLENKKPAQEVTERDEWKGYKVDGHKVVLDHTTIERETAKWLTDTLGGKVELVPRVNEPAGVKSPDYMFDGEPYDFKEITGSGKNVLDGNVRKAGKQSTGFVFDVTNSKLTDKEIITQAEQIFRHKHRQGVKTIIIKRGNGILEIFTRQ